MAVGEWERLIQKVRAEMGRRYDERLTRPNYYAAIWSPVASPDLKEAQFLKEVLLRECAGRSLLDYYAGETCFTPYGPVLVLREHRPFPFFSPEQETGEAWILRAFRIIYGIGPITEARLKEAGYSTLFDLARHPRWAWQVHHVLQALERRDLPVLMHLVSRKFPLSHPVTLSLMGFLAPEDVVFLDIETMGLYAGVIILIGLARPQREGLAITHIVAREISEELPALAILAEELKKAKALVTYNGRAFDVAMIQARMRYYGLPQEIFLPNFDLLPFARRYFREFLPDCRLETVEKILAVERHLDIPSALVPEFYLAYLREKNVGPLVAIIEHNRQDLISLALLLKKLWEEMVVRGL